MHFHGAIADRLNFYLMCVIYFWVWHRLFGEGLNKEELYGFFLFSGFFKRLYIVNIALCILLQNNTPSLPCPTVRLTGKRKKKNSLVKERVQLASRLLVNFCVTLCICQGLIWFRMKKMVHVSGIRQSNIPQPKGFLQTVIFKQGNLLTIPTVAKYSMWGYQTQAPCNTLKVFME